MCSITGIGLLTAASVIGETNGFDLIRNKRQLTSYAGLDVKEKQSGTSVKGKPRISKKGNKHLRKAMHMPALTAIRHDERYKAIFARLVSKHGIKMKAAVAVQRKLLEMMYTIYKTNKPYDKSFFKKQNEEANRLIIEGIKN
jgi:transposase